MTPEVDDLRDLFRPRENILGVLLRIEHLLALDLVMRHGTTDQAERAQQHLIDELARQEREH